MDRIKYLLLQFLRQEASSAEQAELEAWAAEAPENRALLEEIQDPDRVAQSLAKLDRLNRERSWARVEAHGREHRPAGAEKDREGNDTGKLKEFGNKPNKPLVRWRRYGVAAAVILLLGLGAWWVTHTSQPAKAPVAATHPADIPAPSRNRATLTLSGGRQVDLDSISSGAVAQQGNTRVVKQAAGELAYQTTVNTLPPNELLYNTLSNPRGSRVITVTLADGTKVWLNAASSIRYPVLFSGSDRRVEMTGEAYFEVAKNKAQPFRVSIDPQTAVDVLGTDFDINAYTDEPELKTSLLEGAIKLSSISGSAILKPGQQAQLRVGANANKGDIKVVDKADMDQVMAWKNGVFFFTNADLPTVLRQLERWYDVTVRYEGGVPTGTFNGEIGRSLTLDQVLKLLATTRVHYTIEPGHQLVIRP